MTQYDLHGNPVPRKPLRRNGADKEEKRFLMFPHTRAKHDILTEYLKPWFYIIQSRREYVQYMDAFAGAGRYERGEDGSPLIAMEVYNNHILKKSMTLDVRFLFIELNEKSIDLLKSRTPPDMLGKNVTFFKGSFSEAMESLYNENDPMSQRMCNTFAFIDPYGHSGMPMGQVRRIIESEKCDVMITLMTDSINRNAFASEKNQAQGVGLDELYGSDVWKEVLSAGIGKMPKRIDRFVDIYIEEAMKYVPKDRRYSLQFKMKKKNGHEAYRLVFLTKHLKGLECMKESMLKVDPTGGYTYYDASHGTCKIIDLEESKRLRDVIAANQIYEFMKGRTCTGMDLDELFLIGTGFTYRASMLSILESDGRIVVSSNGKRRAKGTYPDSCKIRFV